jgi:hypothetical protein
VSELSAATRLLTALRLTADALDERHQPWALVGGLAISVGVEPGIEPEICRDAERLEVAPGLVVPVAQAGHLVAMKILAHAPDRPQDGVDLRALIDRLTPGELQRARAAVSRIEQAGANRAKRLLPELERWLSHE